jgi:hypothetical protein
MNIPGQEGGAISAATGMPTPSIPPFLQRLPPTAGNKLDDTDLALIQSIANKQPQQQSSLLRQQYLLLQRHRQLLSHKRWWLQRQQQI